MTAVLVGLGFVISLGLIGGQPAGWWAAWGQWIGGIGSVAAAMIALRIAHASREHAEAIAREGWERAEAEHRKQEVRFHAERLDRDKSQARQVSGAVVLYLPAANETAPPPAEVRLQNRSAKPILKAKIIRVDGPVDYGPDVGFANPTALESSTVQGNSSLSFRPMDLLTANLFHGFAEPVNPDDYAVTIMFMDATGLWWQRTDLDEPVRVDPEGNLF